MDEIRVEFVHIDRLFHVRRGGEAGEWGGGGAAEAGDEIWKGRDPVESWPLGVRMKGDRRWAGYLDK